MVWHCHQYVNDPEMAWLALVGVILVHSWYPAECCNGDGASGDCHPIPCESVTEKSDGFHWQNLLFKGAMVRASKDGQCHVCHGHESGQPAFPHCLFLENLS